MTDYADEFSDVFDVVVDTLMYQSWNSTYARHTSGSWTSVDRHFNIANESGAENNRYAAEMETPSGKDVYHVPKWATLKQPLYAVVLLSVAYIVVAFLGIVNNTLVIAVIYRQAKMRTVTNYFLANLATADVLVCIMVLPITLLENVYTGKARVCTYFLVL